MSRNNRDQDILTIGYSPIPAGDRDLQLLGNCWYAFSALMLLTGFFPLLFMALGILFLSYPETYRPPPYFLIITGASGAITCWASAILALLVARAMHKHTRRMLCLVTAGLACVAIPIGTAIGVCTFYVLSRPGVRAAFS